ncbi:dihydrolipoyl dehydrogenase family protein [Nocardioides caldifontis]|uniref:dihydrolipoyl dehydrogenase family protein n=1 Tax=Nocardioides caldifontis TaxID=2588938 RepID=UPI0011DF5DDC|nr:NAD(P)/FAD-dependent oxidoreductase [Nocardioides caldifontis]
MTSGSGSSSTSDVDVVVVGLGPGGEAAATKLAAAGLSVVAVDKHLVGGECPYYGCIPTKMMIRAADALAEARRVPGLAGEATTVADWAHVARRIREEATDDWDDTVAVERLERAGATVVHGLARLVGPRTVEVDGRTYRASRGVVVNTGTAPGAPPVDGLATTPYWTNRDVVRMDRLPGSMAVVGGGAIGCEVAQAVARFGVRVTVLEVADRILAPEEPEASALVTSVFTGEGIRVVAGTTIKRVDHGDGTFTVTLEGETVEADRLLVAAGRRANLADLGLESVGLDPASRFLDTDGRMRVLRDGEPVEGLWAVGDVTGKGAFTHTSMYHSGIVVRDILGEDGPEADFRALPRVTFTDPEVGSVGLTEAKAREQGLDVRTGSAQLPSSSRGFIHAAGNDGLIKLVAEGDQLVGATSVGPSGGEVLSMLTTAIHGRVPVSTLRSMIYAYPTFHRAVLDALEDLG